jgi:hypothetical protein
MVIIKYYEWMILDPSLRGVVYRKYDDATFGKNCKRADDEESRPKKDQGKEIPREEALRLIRDNNLKIVHKNKYGTIWR